MPAASLTLPHRYKLSKTDCKPSPTAVFHKRLANSLSDVYQRTRGIFQAKLNPIAKETWDTASKDGGDDGAPIDHHKPYNALVLLFNPGYLRAGNLFPARLHTPKSALNAHSGHQVDLGPALRIGPLPTFDRTPQALGIPSTGDHYRAATGESSSQKRPPASPGKSENTSKKQRKESRHHGVGALSDTGSGNNEDDEGDPSRDGPRFPLPTNSPDETFRCPFYRKDPDRYDTCKGHRIKSISYVTQHIGRCHRLKEVRMGVQDTAGCTDGDSTKPERTTDPNKLVYYCETCRQEFRGPGADARCDHHSCCEQPTCKKLTCPCRKRSIAETGVLLPEECDDLKSEVRKVKGNMEKWTKIWTTLFPGTSVPSPFNEAEEAVSFAVSTGDVAQPNNDFQPIPSAVNETPNHDPPQDFASQMPDCIQPWEGGVFFNIPYDPNWGNFGNLDHAGSLISNVPTDLQPTGPAPNFMQPLISKSTQSPTFPNNNWPQSEYHRRP
ncbi:ankyrin protein [Fusarium mexicanum]|uniref:Ankyrin protein n=1 Tax=Fusarium mexicanum TaxID=751941 RepID=A0A8H5IAC7_9HYPO|nr:ankyrin protein [Fusarium mexicanum]